MTQTELLEQLKGALSQEEFAACIGVSQAQVSRVLSGEPAGRRFIQGLVRAFSQRTDDIVAVFFAKEYANRNDQHTDMDKLEVPCERS